LALLIRVAPELDFMMVVTAGYHLDNSSRAFQVQSSIFRDALREFRLRAELEARHAAASPP
jgi:hypothetical protein